MIVVKITPVAMAEACSGAARDERKRLHIYNNCLFVGTFQISKSDIKKKIR